jgi:ABC-2 type transport system permease protein
MNARRLRALFRRVVQEIRRDRPSLALLFVAPVVMTGLLTFILREATTPATTTAIVNDAGAPGSVIAGALGSALEAADVPVTEMGDAAAHQAVQDGDTSVAIILPADLATGGDIVVLTNGLDPFAESSQIGVVQQALVSAVATSSAASRLPGITHETVWGTPSDDPIAPFAPAIVGFFAYFFVYILTGVSFLRERTGGTLERLMATPVTRGEVVGGYTLGFGLFATIQVAILLTWVLGTVHVPAIGPLPEFSVGLGVAVNGSPLLAFLVVLLVAVGAVSLGIFLSTFARTELQIVQFIPIVIVPQFLLSGVLFPVSSLPSILQPLVAIMPLNYAVNGLRQVFIRGADLATPELQLDLLVLAAIAAFFAVIASLTIRRDVA